MSEIIWLLVLFAAYGRVIFCLLRRVRYEDDCDRRIACMTGEHAVYTPAKPEVLHPDQDCVSLPDLPLLRAESYRVHFGKKRPYRS